MNKVIIVSVVFIILLAIAIGWGWSLQKDKVGLRAQIKTLNDENTILQGKIDAGLSYAKALDSMMEAARQSAGLPTRTSLSSEEEWLAAFTAATDATADKALQDNLKDIKAGGKAATKASVLYMDHAVSSTVDSLK